MLKCFSSSKLPILIFTAAFLLRFFDLLAKPPFMDENLHIAAGVWYVNSGIWSFNFYKPPFWKLIIGAVLWLAGVRTTPWTPLHVSYTKYPYPLLPPPPAYVLYIARLLSVLVGSLTAVLVYYLAKELTNDWKTSLVSGLFLALYPIHLNLSRMAMLDVPLNFFVALTLLLMYRALTRNDKRYLIAGSFAYGLALGTKEPAIMILPILLILTIALPNRKRVTIELPNRKRVTIALPNRKNLTYVGLSTLIASAIFFATWPYLWSNPLGNLKAILAYWTKLHLGVSTAPYSFWSWCILNATPIPVLIFFLFGFALAVRRLKRPMVLLALTWFLVPFTFMTISIPVHYPHYIVWLTPSICLIAGYGLTALENRMRKILLYNGSHPLNLYYMILIAVVILTTLLVLPAYPLYDWLAGGLHIPSPYT